MNIKIELQGSLIGNFQKVQTKIATLTSMETLNAERISELHKYIQMEESILASLSHLRNVTEGK